MTDVAHHPEKVEIKANAYDDNARFAADVFHLTANNGNRRRIWFCESRSGLEHGRLDLLERRLILRLRITADEPDDTTVKLRDEQDPTPPDPWTPYFRVEGDWSGEQQLISASFTEKVESGQIEEALRGDSNISRAFAADQEDYLRQALRPSVRMDDLKCLGPIQAVKWSDLEDDDFGHELRAERWKINDLRVLEFSIRVDWEEAVDAQLGLNRILADRRIDLSGPGIPKTTLVLRHLAGITS
jgi:hypothetical protein